LGKAVLGAVFVAAVALSFLCPALADWPGTWYDEGITLQVARNLVDLGRYGIQSPDGFRGYSPIVSTGPTVSVPIALVFAVGGLGLLQARIVMVIYALLSVLSMYVLAVRLFNVRAAVIGSLLLISVGATSGDTSASFLGLARMVMGEVPALAFILTGSLLWSKSIESRSKSLLISSGVLWGLAIVTKPQAVFLVGGCVLAWAVLGLTRRGYDPLDYLTPLLLSLLTAGMWLVWQHLGSVGVREAEVAERIGTQVTLLVPRLIIKSTRVLLSQPETVWGLPALFYGFYLALTSRHPAQAVPMLFLAGTSLTWLMWFVLGSVGWGRYVFPPFAIMAFFCGKLFADLIEESGWSFPRSAGVSLADLTEPSVIRGVGIFVAVTLMVVGPLQSVARDIIMTRSDSAAAFADDLDGTLRSGTVIECFEPEVVFLSRGGFEFHQPSLPVLNTAIQHVQLGLPYPDGHYDVGRHGAAYLIHGPFAKLTGLYDRELQSSGMSMVTSVDAYDLYEIRDTGGD